MPQTIAVKLKPSAERQVKKGHPWVFKDAIQKENKTPKTGDIAIIFDAKKNSFLAIGLYDMSSPIRIKVIQAHEKIKLDQYWILKQFKQAYEIRKPLFKHKTNAYRLINGENDHFPTLIVDIYAKVAVIKLYSTIWKHHIQDILEAIKIVAKPECIVLRCGRNAIEDLAAIGLVDGDVLYGELTNPEVAFEEYGVKFSANVLEGHKTGYFLDHRENRHKVSLLAKGKNLLDVFSYAGGFSVHALTKGAKVVTSVDISAQALALAQKNAELNRTKGKHEIICGDAFSVLKEIQDVQKQFDIVVVDPPSFAKQASEIDKAISSYKKLAHLAPKLVKPKGILIMASCSSRVTSEVFFETIEKQFEEDGVRFQLKEKTFHAKDHPIGFPEGAYLKTGYYIIYKA